MAGKNRREIFVKGLGNLEIRQTSPVSEADFTSMGFLLETMFSDISEMESVKDERGNAVDYLPKARAVTVETSLLQSSKEKLDILRNATAKLFSVRYFGDEGGGYFKYFALDQSRLNPSLSAGYKPGLRSIPVAIAGLTEAELGYDVPLYYLIETRGMLSLSGLKLWIEPREADFPGVARILDASGFQKHGALNSDYATIWQSGTYPVRFLRLDGVNDFADHGNVLTMNGTEDHIFEFWIRIQGADASLQEIIGKKAGTTNEDGYMITRSTGNKIQFKISDGATSATFSSASNLLQNVWKHVLIAIDRDGNITGYFNGVADGTPVACSGVGDSTSADNLYLGRVASGYGQVDIGGVRVYNYGAGGLPSTVASMALAHYTAERGYYNV